MSRFSWLSKKVVLSSAVVLFIACGGVLWLERGPLWSWYCVSKLAHAEESQQAVWLERVAVLGENAVPSLLDYLTASDPAACRNACAGLVRLTKHWGLDDPRTLALAMRCGREFARFSASGQQGVVEMAAGWYHPAPADSLPPPSLLPLCVRILGEASTSTDAGTQERALELCAVLLAHPQGAEVLSAGRDLVRNCLASTNAENRLRAVQLTLHPGMDLYESVAALLSDPAVEVRRAAILVAGPAENAVLDDTLLPALHDEDAEVRRLCQVALQSRGRTPEQLRLGFLLTAPNPAIRIQVVDYLQKVPEVDAALWLKRISHDRSPAIRAAAARAMSEGSVADSALSERLEEMARTDPSATVCLLAKYYRENPERPER